MLLCIIYESWTMTLILNMAQGFNLEPQQTLLAASGNLPLTAQIDNMTTVGRSFWDFHFDILDIISLSEKK